MKCQHSFQAGSNSALWCVHQIPLKQVGVVWMLGAQVLVQSAWMKFITNIPGEKITLSPWNNSQWSFFLTCMILPCAITFEDHSSCTHLMPWLGDFCAMVQRLNLNHVSAANITCWHIVLWSYIFGIKRRGLSNNTTLLAILNTMCITKFSKN